MGAIGGLLLGLGISCVVYGWVGGVVKRRLESGRLAELTSKQSAVSAIALPLLWAGVAMFALGVVLLIVSH